MLHIIILNKNYFPTKLNAVKPTDKVIILASPDGSIPVSAYKDEVLKNVEQAFSPEHPFVESVKCSEGRFFAAAVFCLPLHKAVKS